jgi:hypothetical protein
MSELCARARRVAPLVSSLAAAITLAASPFQAAAAYDGAREVWAGSYECGAIAKLPKKWAAYTAKVELVLENGQVTVGRETARLIETMRGLVDQEGHVTLEGGGRWKDPSMGTSWLFQYAGRFRGERFEAAGTMYSPDGKRVMRECAMSLVRKASGNASMPGKPVAAQAAPQAPKAVTAAPDARTATVVSTALAAAHAAQADAPPAAKSGLPGALPEDAAVAPPREVDLAGPHNVATIQDVVAPGAPHRYGVWARNGDVFSVVLHSSHEGVRFVVYEPGAAARLTDAGLAVEGVALRGTVEAGRFTAPLPMAGRYLVVVDAESARAPYTLEVAVVGTVPSIAEPRNPLLLAVLLGTAAAAAGVAVYRRRQERRGEGMAQEPTPLPERSAPPIMQPPVAPGLELPPAQVSAPAEERARRAAAEPLAARVATPPAVPEEIPESMRTAPEEPARSKTASSRRRRPRRRGRPAEE